MPKDTVNLVEYIRRAFVMPFTSVAEKERIFEHLYDLPEVALHKVAGSYQQKYGETLREAVNEEWLINLNPFDDSWKTKLLERMGQIGL